MLKNELTNLIFSKVDDLPTVPSILPGLLKAIGSAKSSVTEVKEVVSLDLSLSALVLKAANSAYYGFSHKIYELDRAINLLGFKIIGELALSLEKYTTPTDGDDKLSMEKLWKDSLTIGLIMKEISERHLKKRDAERLYIIGLLHGIGKVLLNEHYHEEFSSLNIEDSNHTSGKDIMHQKEQEIFGCNHGEVGAILLERWNIPEKIYIPIKEQFQEKLSESSSTIIKDIFVLRLAKQLVREIPAQNIDDKPIDNYNFNREEIDYLNISNEDLKELIELSKSVSEKVNKIFNDLK